MRSPGNHGVFGRVAGLVTLQLKGCGRDAIGKKPAGHLVRENVLDYGPPLCTRGYNGRQGGRQEQERPDTRVGVNTYLSLGPASG
jgi:hypothetical protein